MFTFDRKRGFDGITMSSRNVNLHIGDTGLAVAQSKYQWIVGIAPFSYVAKVRVEHRHNTNPCNFYVALYQSYSTDLSQCPFYRRYSLAASTEFGYEYDVHFPIREVLGIRVYNQHATDLLKYLRVQVEIRQNREGKV